MKNAGLFIIGCAVSLILLELFLRVFHPFEFRVRNGRIVLPANKRYVMTQDKIAGVDRHIIHQKNSLGFRGKALPENSDKYLTIITVGGSTTECFYLSDGKTWTDRLQERLGRSFGNLWVNNAGLDGQSTYGHILLMENYIVKLHPKMVIFLIGLNDVERDDLSRFDAMTFAGGFSYKNASKWLADHSEIFSTALNIGRFMRARKQGVAHGQIELKKDYVDIGEGEAAQALDTNKARYLAPFRKRLEELVKISKDNGISPVFITQSALYGPAIDDVTGVDLGRIRVGDINGKLKWEILELYNDVTRQVASEHGILCIDMARKMPKSSKYYYDLHHYNNLGAEKFAEISDEDLRPFLAKRYRQGTFIK